MRVPVVVIASLLAAATVAADPAPASAGDGTALLPLIADDVQVVAVIDVADSRDAPMFQDGVDFIYSRASDLEVMMAMAGIDAMRDVDTVLIAARYGPTGNLYDLNQQLQVVIEGGFDKKRLTKLMATATRKKHRSVKYWDSNGTELAILGKRLVITVSGGMPAVIDRYKKKGKSLAKSADAAVVRGAIAGTDVRHDAWMAGVMPQTSAQSMSALGYDAQTFSIGVTMETSMVVELRLRMLDAATASGLLTMLSGQLKQLKRLASGVGLSGTAGSLGMVADGDVIDVDVTVPDSELGTVVKFISML